MTDTRTEVDQLDLTIIRGLQLSPRVPFRALADVLEVSEQTVARRFRSLEDRGIVRVTTVARAGASGQSNWIVRVQCRPSGAESLAQALAQRDDVSWVALMSGGVEVGCTVRSRSDEARDDLLMQRLPRTAPVLGLSVSMMLHLFVGGEATPVDEWTALSDVLTPDQQQAVLDASELRMADPGPFEAEPGDAQLLDALRDDGRASVAHLARAAGMTESRAARRLRTLIRGGAAYFHVDLATSALGYSRVAMLWLTVVPAELDRAGTTLGARPEVPFAAAITGTHNLAATVVCRDEEHLYRFVTDTVGSIAGVQAIEIGPVLRQVKQSGALVDGARLRPPTSRPAGR